MNEGLPVITGKDLLDFYLKLGCELKRVKGSHHVVQSIYNGSMFVITVHSNEELDRGLLRAIIRQSGVYLNMDEKVIIRVNFFKTNQYGLVFY